MSMKDNKLGPGLAADEPILAHMRVWPSFGQPSLLDLMMAFSTYAVSTCSNREERMEAIFKMVEAGEYEKSASR